MDTTDDFHTYRIIKVKQDMLVYIIDKFDQPELILEAKSKSKSGYAFNRIAFGDASSDDNTMGVALWDLVRFTPGTEPGPIGSLAVVFFGKLATTWANIKCALE